MKKLLIAAAVLPAAVGFLGGCGIASTPSKPTDAICLGEDGQGDTSQPMLINGTWVCPNSYYWAPTTIPVPATTTVPPTPTQTVLAWSVSKTGGSYGCNQGGGCFNDYTFTWSTTAPDQPSYMGLTGADTFTAVAVYPNVTEDLTAGSVQSGDSVVAQESCDMYVNSLAPNTNLDAVLTGGSCEFNDNPAWTTQAYPTVTFTASFPGSPGYASSSQSVTLVAQ